MRREPSEGQAATRPGAERRIVQVHRALACNLACGHCYSSSGPAARANLDSRVVQDALDDARGLGYDTVSFSGGEPFLDPQFPVLARYARSLGMGVIATTNATVLTDRRLDQVASVVAGMAVSVDGPPSQHNQLRGAPWAFDRMREGLAALRRHQIPFGVIHTLTTTSIQHLPWLADFALAEGARLLHIHPLELTGRAASSLSGLHLGTGPLERAYLTALFLAAAHRDKLAVQFDALLRAEILNHPELLCVPASGSGREPGDALRTLVIEPDGTVVPVAWGFSHHYAIASLRSERLTAGYSRWLTGGRASLTYLGQHILDLIQTSPDLTVVNWLEWLVAQSHSQAMPSVAGVPNATRLAECLCPARVRKAQSAVAETRSARTRLRRHRQR